MNAILTRTETGDTGTFGNFVLDDGTSYFSLECPWRDNQTKISCVPAGTYDCEIYQSPKHGTIYMLQNVPSRADCEIHPANWAGDASKGYKCQLEGCIALGLSQGVLDGQDAIMSSDAAIADFMQRQAGQRFNLTINDVEAPS